VFVQGDKERGRKRYMTRNTGYFILSIGSVLWQEVAIWQTKLLLDGGWCQTMEYQICEVGHVSYYWIFYNK
jgi:hypothetical protein